MFSRRATSASGCAAAGRRLTDCSAADRRLAEPAAVTASPSRPCARSASSSCSRTTSERLGLTWLAGRQGGNRVLTGETRAASRPWGQVGHLNFIHPFRVQILGAAEIAYLRGADRGRAARESIDRLFGGELVARRRRQRRDAAAVRCSSACNARARRRCSPRAQPSPHLVDVLRLYLRACSPRSTTLHGVFLDVLEIGVLITGASAIGKSELALELISRGNGLVADDIVELYRISPDTVEGRCPAMLQRLPRGARHRRAQHPHDLRRDRGAAAQAAAADRPPRGPQPRGASRSSTACKVDATYQEVLGVPIRRGDDPGGRRAATSRCWSRPRCATSC
ncbi:MAG: HPr kinase/phosphorylase [Comamonadaceae bacterium]|nr:HPr kinase/phosphorylase [Comamonadaceae bacterium]